MGSQGSSATANRADTAVFTLRVDREKLDRLREIAAADHRTLVQQLRHMIDERLAADEQVAA